MGRHGVGPSAVCFLLYSTSAISFRIIFVPHSEEWGHSFLAQPNRSHVRLFVDTSSSTYVQWTHTFGEADQTSMQNSGNPSLKDVVGFYINSLNNGERNQVQQELLKFIRWCGYDRSFSTLTPPEVGRYAETLGAYGTTPDSSKRLEMVRGFLTFASKQGLIQQNLAQHARFRKAKARRQNSANTPAAEEVHLTPEGFEDLKQQLETLKKELVPLAEDIRKAAADKDVRENAPLEAAREHQGHIQSRIREIERKLQAAVVVSVDSAKNSKVVRIGSAVELQDVGSGRKMVYRLVNPSEANPLDGRISSISPVGKALLNQPAGKEVQVVTPGGVQRYLVLGVSV